MRAWRLGLLTALAGASPAAAASHHSWDNASRVGQVGLIAIALGVPAAKGDWTGDLQAAGSIGAAFLVTEGLKEIFPEERPDHSDDRSFPSNHTSTAFAAAATLQNRYGWQVGLPATLVAAFVGVARVEAKKHHWYDVAAGAAIGEASGWLITTKHDANVRVVPWGDTKGGGLAMAARF